MLAARSTWAMYFLDARLLHVSDGAAEAEEVADGLVPGSVGVLSSATSVMAGLVESSIHEEPLLALLQLHRFTSYSSYSSTGSTCKSSPTRVSFAEKPMAPLSCTTAYPADLGVVLGFSVTIGYRGYSPICAVTHFANEYCAKLSAVVGS